MLNILRLFPVMKNHLGKCYLSSTTLNWKFHETFFNPPQHTSRCSILQDKEVLSALTFSRTACLYSRFSVNCWILSNRGNGIQCVLEKFPVSYLCSSSFLWAPILFFKSISSFSLFIFKFLSVIIDKCAVLVLVSSSLGKVNSL